MIGLSSARSRAWAPPAASICADEAASSTVDAADVAMRAVSGPSTARVLGPFDLFGQHLLALLGALSVEEARCRGRLCETTWLDILLRKCFPQTPSARGD